MKFVVHELKLKSEDKVSVIGFPSNLYRENESKTSILKFIMETKRGVLLDKLKDVSLDPLVEVLDELSDVINVKGKKDALEKRVFKICNDPLNLS
jgi:hypothetical protein